VTARKEISNDQPDDRPPICPACGVTMGIVAGEQDVRYVCLECGFGDGRE
jgi:predicted RNA-binding Zn-ribbon protein involved in translation (DUF1610 family)